MRSLLSLAVLSLAASAFAADPPCYDNANRYADCGNGTVTDEATALVWLKDADCLGTHDYAAANAAAAQLASGQCGLTDGSQPGDWRLPTYGEWKDAMSRALKLGCTNAGAGDPPALVNDPGTACLAVGPTSFMNVRFGQLDAYWASTSSWFGPTSAFTADLGSGFIVINPKASQLPYHTWPVRGIGGSKPR